MTERSFTSGLLETLYCFSFFPLPLAEGTKKQKNVQRKLATRNLPRKSLNYAPRSIYSACLRDYSIGDQKTVLNQDYSNSLNLNEAISETIFTWPLMSSRKTWFESARKKISMLFALCRRMKMNTEVCRNVRCGRFQNFNALTHPRSGKTEKWLFTTYEIQKSLEYQIAGLKRKKNVD